MPPHPIHHPFVMRDPLVLLAAASLVLTGLAVTVLLVGTREPPRPALVAAVAESRPPGECLSPSCKTRQEVNVLLGFELLEPTEAKEGLVLWERTVPVNELPLPVREEIAASSGVPLSSVPTTDQSNVAVLSYRFRGSEHIPAVWIYEERAVIEGVPPRLRLREPSCGSELRVGSRSVLFMAGGVERMPPDEGNTWSVCQDGGAQGLDMHSIVFAEGSLIIEMQGFPEAGISKDDLLGMAASFR